MLLELRDVLSAADLRQAREILAGAPWTDGRVTAGQQAATVKNNEQIPNDSEAAKSLRELVLRALEKNVLFFSAALPRHVFPPMFNRYAGATNTYGNHVDAAIRYAPSGRVRTDISCTLFFSDPSEYDGGELVVEDTYGLHEVKLPAGDLILYPASSLHRVEPVTRGERVASFFWIQSLVRNDARRALLFDMDVAIQTLAKDAGQAAPAIVSLTGAYHNLLRMWAEL